MTKGVPPKELVEELKRNRSAPSLEDAEETLTSPKLESPAMSYELPSTNLDRNLSGGKVQNSQAVKISRNESLHKVQAGNLITKYDLDWI